MTALLSRSVAALSLASVLTSQAGAVTTPQQGSLGTTSTGVISINASVPNRIEISGLTDVSLLNQDPSVNAVSSQTVCVWSNSSTRGYNITATGNSTAGSGFNLASAAGSVPYAVNWTDAKATSATLVSGTNKTGFKSTATSPDCSSGPAAAEALKVTILAADLQSMQGATTYTGTLTLVVAPE
jgi:hypothetical protein